MTTRGWFFPRHLRGQRGDEYRAFFAATADAHRAFDGRLHRLLEGIARDPSPLQRRGLRATKARAGGGRQLGRKCSRELDSGVGNGPSRRWVRARLSGRTRLSGDAWICRLSEFVVPPLGGRSVALPAKAGTTCLPRPGKAPRCALRGCTFTRPRTILPDADDFASHPTLLVRARRLARPGARGGAAFASRGSRGVARPA